MWREDRASIGLGRCKKERIDVRAALTRSSVWEFIKVVNLRCTPPAQLRWLGRRGVGVSECTD